MFFEKALAKEQAPAAQWNCDCEGTFDVCSFTTCYSDCSDGVPMKSAAKSETAKAALPAEGGQNDKSLESPAAQWNCDCEGTFDVCSLTTCYHHEQCTLSGKSMNNSKPVGVAAGDHQWACDCQGLRGYCSLTTCYSDCSDGVPMESARVEQILV